MSFGLKNTGSTYQKMVNKVFKHQIRTNMKAYVDQMLVKNMTFEQHLKDLENVFLFCFGQMLDEVKSFQVCICHQKRKSFRFPSKQQWNRTQS